MKRIRWMRLFVLAVAALLATGCNADYQQGYRQGQKEAREMRKDLGSFAKPTHQFIEELGIEPGDSGKSDDWNRGYRQGIRDEFKQ